MARIIYVMGASGVGKDTLLCYVRRNTVRGSPWVVAHRYITRASDSGTENHIELTDTEFDHHQAAGMFALHWQSHDCRYGIGVEIDEWLARGFNVVVNGSRAYLDCARALYPALLAVKIIVSDAVLEQRLSHRGRETATEIRSRLQRADDLDRVHCPGLKEIRNDGPVEIAGDVLLALCASGVTGS